MRQPAVRVERTRETVHADLAALELELLDAARDGVRPGLGAGTDVGDPVLRRVPALQERRHLDDRGRLSDRRENQHVELGVAADRRQIPGIGRIEVPHHRPAPQHDGVEAACRHLFPHGRIAPVTFGEREARQFKRGAHDGFL